MGGRVVTEGGKRRRGGATNPASKVDAEVGEKGGRSTGGWERRGGFLGWVVSGGVVNVDGASVERRGKYFHKNRMGHGGKGGN